jgi:UDP-glucose 4-epimerase
MKILIIGSSGFIGSHLYEAFEKKGYLVTGCDIISPRINQKSFLSIPSGNAEFSNLFDGKLYDICINASGTGSVPFSICNPADDFRMNVTNVYLLLHNIHKFQPNCKFINFSSAAVYGNPVTLPINENHPSSPLSPYGFHKMLSEHICNEFYKLYKLPSCNLRVFSAFGPGLRKQLFWDLAQKASDGWDVELFGDGNESRDFIFIDDLVSAVEIIMLKASFSGEAINISSGEEISIRYAAENFLKVYKPGVRLRFSGIAKKGDPRNWKSDISVLKAMGFKPQITFIEGLKRYSEWILMEKDL